MKYSELFVGRPDAYAQAYKSGKGYRPIRSRLTVNKIGKHLRGEIVAGVYLLRPEDNAVRFMVFDIDKDDQSLAASVAQSLVIDVPDTSILIEKTGGRGWHVWVFMDEWVEARAVRAFMRHALERVNLTYPVELYPKQDRLRGEGMGNLIRLPLGTHQRTGESGQLYNAFSLPFEVDDLSNPELPIEPAPTSAILEISERRIEEESEKSPDFDSGPSNLPCVDKFQKGVEEGFRDEAMFRLAAYLHRQQIPKEAAWIVLEQANGRNKPPISKSALSGKINSAYSGAGYGLPCSSDLVGLDSPFCTTACPVYETAKRRGGQEVGFSRAFPRMVERDGAYTYQYKTKQGIVEKSVSNFTLDVISRLEMPDEQADVLRVRAQAQGGREDIMDIPVSAFSSKSMFLRELSRAEYAWYGSDVHCQYLKSFLTEGTMDTQVAITKLGRHSTKEGDIWVTPDGIYNGNGRVTEEEMKYTYHRPQHFGRVSIGDTEKSFSLARTKEVMKGIFDVNSLSVMVPIVGWTFSVLFKPWFMRSLGHFPLLMLYGTRGAGKTQLVQRVILPLFGYSSREPQIHFCDTTRYVLVSYGASTTTVPLFLDEYRPNALPNTKLRQLWDIWRHAYAEDTDHRGQADLTRLSYKQTSPIIVAGEEMVIDPAMQERMVQVAMTPDDLTEERQNAFRGIPPMEMASREFIRFSLNTNPDDLLDKARARIAGQWERQVSPRVYDNLLIVSFGLEIWSKMTGRTVTKAMASNIFDPHIMVIGEEGEIRTPLWVDDFILDVAGIVEEKGPFTWGLVETDGDNSVLYINLRRAHAEWAKDMKARGEQAPGLTPIKQQLGEKAMGEYVLATGQQKRMMGANSRVYVIDLTAMRERIDQ